MLQISVLVAIFALAITAAFLGLSLNKSTIAYISGPRPRSWIFGNQVELLQSEAGVANRKWRKTFGIIYRFQSCFGIEWLMLNDPKAIAHVLHGQTTSYHLEESLREFLRLVTGKGIIYADSSEHKFQRRLLQPCFSLSFVKGLTPQFAACASRVTRQWARLKEGSGNRMAEVDAYDWSERLTMEAIGQTVFGVRFGTIEGEAHELARAYKGFLSTAFSQPTRLFIFFQALLLCLPPWLLVLADRLPVKRLNALRAAKASSLDFSRNLIQEKRKQQQISREHEQDVLSILTQAGDVDVKGRFARMTEEEIYAQLTTFFVAGYETSCNTLAFALYEIARNEGVQERLYVETSKVLGRLPDAAAFEYVAFESMPFLVAVVKETLRLHAVVAHGLFKAGKDDLIPLSRPITTTRGDIVHAIPVKKGQRVFLSFDGVNRLEDIWGADANEFRPERWLTGDLDDFVTEDRCGGPYANLANFGGGPKTCLAWRFAVIELQTFLAVLVIKFHFHLVDPDFRLRRDGCHIVVTPSVHGQEPQGPCMPLRIEARAT